MLYFSSLRAKEIVMNKEKPFSAGFSLFNTPTHITAPFPLVYHAYLILSFYPRSSATGETKA